MYRKNPPRVQQAIMALRGRVPRKPPVPTLHRDISSTAPRHKKKPNAPTAPEQSNSSPLDLSQVDKTTNTKKSKKEPSPLAEIRRIQKMSVEELKEVIVSSGYELPDCTLHSYLDILLTVWLHYICILRLTIIVIFQDTCTWPKDYNPEIEFMDSMEKRMKDQKRRERHEQRQKGEQSEQKGSPRGGR